MPNICIEKTLALFVVVLLIAFGVVLVVFILSRVERARLARNYRHRRSLQ